MAGIGFELRKLFEKDGIVAKMKAISFSTIVTVGPTLICIGMMIIFDSLLKAVGVDIVKREVFQTTIMYSFVFSLILTSGYSIVLSRYLSDKIYEEKYEDIKPSLFGSISIIVLIASILGMSFYLKSSLDVIYRFLAYILFLQIVIEVILSVYVTALKNYKKIIIGFTVGFGIAILCGASLIKLSNIEKITISLLSFNLGILILNLFLFNEIQKYFKGGSNKYFEFLTYFKKFKLLFIANLMYTLGLYIHNFIFWALPSMSKIVGNTYLFAPEYDVSTFYAFLTTLPTTIIFVIKVETAFFKAYRDYFYCINKGASYKDIEIARDDMKAILYRELGHLMIIQFIFTVLSIVVGRKLLMNIGFDNNMIEIFTTLTLGFYGIIITFVIMTLLLYFDDRIGAVIITSSFFIINVVATCVTIYMGSSYYGFGVFISGIVSMVIALKRMNHFVDNIDYYVFCKNALWSI